MNKKQRIVLWVGIVLILLMGLFPPWTASFSFQGISSTRSAGYHPFFAPPTPFDPAIENLFPGTETTYYFSIAGEVHLDATRLLLQWTLVVLVVSGLILAFKEQHKADK